MQGPGSDLQCCANAKIILILILKILSLIRNWWRQGLFWCDFKISGLIYWPLTVFEALTGLKRQGSSPLGAHPLAGSRRQVMAESNWAGPHARRKEGRPGLPKEWTRSKTGSVTERQNSQEMCVTWLCFFVLSSEIMTSSIWQSNDWKRSFHQDTLHIWALCGYQ